MDITQFPTLLDLCRIEAGIGHNIVNEAVTAFRPEVRLVPADTMQGTEVRLTVLKSLPTVAFRNVNEGTAGSKATWETRVFQCGIIDQPVQADRRIADLAKDRGRFLEQQTTPFMEAVMNHLGNQFYYGVQNDAKGFIGLIAQSNCAATLASHVVDAGASTAKSSVWFLARGMDKLQWLYGNNETITMDGAWKEETLYDADGKAFPGLSNWIKTRPGLRLANKNCAFRVRNIGANADTGHTLTSTHLHSALKLANDLGVMPDVILMNTRSREQYRVSLVTALVPEPAVPKDFMGIPIEVSSAITNAETI